jgi:hypothetical protein
MLKRILAFLPMIALMAALLVVGGRGTSAGEENAGGLRVTKDHDILSIFDGNRPVLRYRYQGAGMRKPYADQLFSPAGVQVLRDSPPDHKHHHGLMYAVTVDKVNFWEENKPEFGSEKHRSLKEVGSGVPDSHSSCGCSEDLDWVGPAADKPLLTERRKIEVLADRGLESSAAGYGATLVDWYCRFSVPEGKDSAVISGTHYNGLGMRFVQTMDKGGRFFNADDKPGEDGPSGCRLVRTRWCAYTAKADGKPVTVALFDHPTNFRHPQTMFTLTMGFAYMSATMNEWREPVTIKAGHPLELRYGVAVWDGAVDKAAVEKLYQRWVGLSGSESAK